MADLAESVFAGERRGIARAITLVESGGKDARDFLRLLRGQVGRAHVVGVTGPPGAGKSTLVGALARALRSRQRTVGVLAVDPTSPFTGGAILGDRVRMQEVFLDPGVFVRSMATRGRLGGLAQATEDAIAVLDAAGKDVILVETVGVGQDEMDVAGAAHTTVVVMVPGAGDAIQTMKAGILEVADVFVVNKGDLKGADLVILDLNALLALNSSPWIPPVLQTVARSGVGVEGLVDALDAHRGYLARSKVSVFDRKARLVARRLLSLVQRDLLDRLEERTGRDELRRQTERVVAGEIDPYSAAEELVERLVSP